MAQTPEQIGAGAPCFSCIPDKLAAIIYLLNTNNMTPEQIAAGAPCFSCIPDKLGAILYLLANGGGGGGGSAQFVTYTSGTPATPADPTKAAWAYDPTGNLASLGWNVNTQTWN